MAASDLTLPEIGERIVYFDARLRPRMAELLELVGEFDARNGAHRRGFRGTAGWLTFECDIDGRTAREYVRVAKRLRTMPKVAEAFGIGRLAYCKVRELTRAAETEDEAALLRIALTSTVRQLEQHIRQLRSAPSADLDVANRTRARRFVRHHWGEDGSLRFFGSLPADDGAAFVEALEAKAATIHGEGGGARRADALVELMTGGGYETLVHLHADPGVLYLQDGPAIPVEMARRLACESMVTIDGLNHGRTTRYATALQKRALIARDGRVCSMPGCHRTHGLHAHHINPWENGGRTDLDNLTLLCRYHHRLFHDDGWTLRRRHGELEIRDAKGRPLPSRAPPPLLAAA